MSSPEVLRVRDALEGQHEHAPGLGETTTTLPAPQKAPGGSEAPAAGRVPRIYNTSSPTHGAFPPYDLVLDNGSIVTVYDHRYVKFPSPRAEADAKLIAQGRRQAYAEISSFLRRLERRQADLSEQFRNGLDDAGFQWLHRLHTTGGDDLPLRDSDDVDLADTSPSDGDGK